VRGAQVLPSLDTAALAAQPLAIHQLRSRQVDAPARATEAVDRIAVEALGVLALAREGERARFDAQRPVGPARPRRLGESAVGVGCPLSGTGPQCGLDFRYVRPRGDLRLARLDQLQRLLGATANSGEGDGSRRGWLDAHRLGDFGQLVEHRGRGHELTRSELGAGLPLDGPRRRGERPAARTSST
jgi:hypothetical protein